MSQRRILLIIGGGIAAYKCLELIRRGQERGLAFRCILTEGGAQFVTPLAVASLSGEKVYRDLAMWSRDDEERRRLITQADQTRRWSLL